MEPARAERSPRDRAYARYKLAVKRWEKEFRETNSRIPSKLDIKEAPARVRYAYKQYFHLKSAALEDSLLDCSLEDDEWAVGSPELLSREALHGLSRNSEVCDLDGLPSSMQIAELFSSAQKPIEVEKIPEKSLENKPTKLIKQLSEKLSKKLIQNSKFSIRNPRKSLSTRLSQNRLTDCNVSAKETNLNTESLDEHISQEPTISKNSHQDAVNPVSIIDKIIINKVTPLRQINEGWIQRASGQVTAPQNNLTSQYTSDDKYGIRNINIAPIIKNNNCTDYVENSESENEETINVQSFKPALKKRKLNNGKCQSNSDIIEESSKQNCPEVPKSKNLLKEKSNTNKNDDSSSSNKTKRQNSKSKPPKKKILKEKSIKLNKEEEVLEPPNIDDFIPIGVEENIIPRFGRESSLFNPLGASGIASNSNIKTVPNTKAPPSAADRLQDKVKNGTLNENFVRINIQKKVFVRGKKSMNFSKYKKQQWKNKKALAQEIEFPEGGKIACFKCGNLGHMSRYCTAHRGDTLLPIDACTTDEIPTLQDMQNKTKDDLQPTDNEIEHLSKFVSSAIPDSFLELLSQTPETCSQSNDVEKDHIQPVYPAYSEKETPKEVEDGLRLFGHESFRPGQEQAIMRILSGLSTLLILSTGGGKSLCYQLPAYIYSKHFKCVTLVISPLVSLMEDQVLSMPEFLKGGCLHTNQSPTQRQKIMQLLKDGELNILLISPEALISGDRSNGFGSLFKNLPPISFACIDEAHCVSQWSHNFRPSYLMICRVLREKLKVKCILGLTATASQPTIKSIIDHINVPDGTSGVITNPALPPNLILSVSYERDKDRALLTLLGSDTFSSYNSIIVYCIRRDECERVAAILRSSLQEPGKVTTERGKKRNRMSYLSEAYHAGMSAAQRRKIQDNFMNGTLRIIVATVAFGMGINKSDIRCIIHYNMPSSFESYVQEVGRAGRDGKVAHCHVFINRDSNDKNELLKHIHSNTIDRHVIRKLLQKVFVPCECKKNFNKISASENRCKGHEVAFAVEETVEELDIASENIATILCYLELHSKRYIQVLNNCYIRCKIFSYGGSQKLIEAAKNCPPLAMAYTLEAKNDGSITKSNILDFPVIDIAAAIGWESGITKYHLKNLEWVMENGRSRRSNLKVEFHTLGLRIRAPGDLTPTELDEMLDSLHDRVQTQEKTMLYQLEEISTAFSKVAKKSVQELFSSSGSEQFEEQSDKLKNVIRNYFQRENILDSDIVIEERPLDEARAIIDIRALVSSYRDCSFTGRAIARILQGIPSPNYPPIIWGRCKFWRSHMHEDFHGLAKLATQQIIDMR